MKERIYIVRSNDSLNDISRNTGIDIKKLAYYNGIKENDKLTEGDILRLPSEEMYYTVQKGDTLYGIARMLGTTVGELAELNGIPDIDKIYAGQVLRLPDAKNEGGTDVYTVKHGDTLWKIAKKYGVTVASLINLNRLRNPDMLCEGQVIQLKKN